MPTITAPAPAASRKQETLADQLVDLERQIADLSEKADNTRKELIASIKLGNSVETLAARLTVYQSTSHTVDFDQLVSLKPGWARRVTRKVLDQSKFALLYKAEQIPDDVLAIVQHKEGPLQLRVTRR